MKPVLKNPVFVLVGILTIISVFIIGVVIGSQFLKEELPTNFKFIEKPPGTQIDGNDPNLFPSVQGSTSRECVIAGCSGQLCIEAGSDSPAMSTCEWREEYACYQQYGTCERQKFGECGWTMTPELSQCLQVAHGIIYFDDPSLTR